MTHQSFFYPLMLYFSFISTMINLSFILLCFISPSSLLSSIFLSSSYALFLLHLYYDQSFFYSLMLYFSFISTMINLSFILLCFISPSSLLSLLFSLSSLRIIHCLLPDYSQHNGNCFQFYIDYCLHINK